MTYIYCKQVISNGTYGEKESMQIKLDVFFINNRLTQEEYEELTNLLATHQIEGVIIYVQVQKV